MNPLVERGLLHTRRRFLGRTAAGIGSAALASLAAPALFAEDAAVANRGLAGLPHFAPKAKRVIYLFQNGAPSQLDLFDYKPKLAALHGSNLPDSIRMGQRLTGMTANQAAFPVVGSKFRFTQHGQSGTWFSSLLPHMASVADHLCVVKTVHTEAINHDPAMTFFQTGFQQAGRPSMGAWLSYGLGSENRDLPAFVVMISQGSARRDDQPLFARLWGPGFLPSKHQGVQFRSVGDPVLYLSNPPGIDGPRRREILDLVSRLNEEQRAASGDPETTARIAQYELAYRMQTSVPELTDMSDEPEHVLAMYGEQAKVKGSYAFNCLLARRLVERGVRFVQLYHRGWDHHFNLPSDLSLQCGDVDQASAALVRDLHQRGLLDETLLIWGGEFGRTVYNQGKLLPDSYGRDHHPRCFSVWMAGGGIRPGVSHGETDDYCYNIVADPVDVFDLHATMLHCLGVDHTRLTHRFQGRDYRLTDVHGKVVEKLLA